MKKIFRFITVLAVLLPLLLASCSDSSSAADERYSASSASGASGSTEGATGAAANAYKSLVDVRFSIPNLAVGSETGSKMVAGEVTADDDYDVNSMYWRYTALHTSDSNAPGNTGDDETTITDAGIPGLQATVSGFAPGYWQFCLFAYKDADYQTILYRGSLIVHLEESDTVKEFSVPVRKIMLLGEGQYGSMEIVSDITFKDIATDVSETFDLVATYKTFNNPDDSPIRFTTDSDELPRRYYASGTDGHGIEPGTYEVTLTFKYEGVSYADVILVSVYSNFKSVIKGEMDYRKLSDYPIKWKTFTTDSQIVDYNGDNLEYLSNTNGFHRYTSESHIPAGEKAYYDFLGWSTYSDWRTSLTSVADYSILPARTYDYDDDGYISLYACFTPTNYTITYDLNAETTYKSGVNKESEVSEDLTATATDVSELVYTYNYETSDFILTKNFTRDGYDFLAWTSGTDKTTGTSLSDYTVSEGTHGDLDFFVRWKAHEYDVVFEKNAPATRTDADVTGEMEHQKHVFDTNTNLSPNAYVLDGYTFSGWSTTKTDSSDGGNTTFTDGEAVHNLTTKTDDVPLYALWTQNEYTVKYLTNTNVEGFVNPELVDGEMDDETFTYDAPSELSDSLFTHPGYTFIGWSTTTDGSSGLLTTGTDSEKVWNFTTESNAVDGEGVVYLYAQWRVNTVTLSFEIENYVFEDSATTSTSGDYGAVYNGESVVTSVSSIKYGEVFAIDSVDTFKLYVTNTDASGTTDTKQTVQAKPTTSTTSYAYSFVSWQEESFPAGNVLTTDTTIKVRFMRNNQPKANPSAIRSAIVNIDFSVDDTYENAPSAVYVVLTYSSSTSLEFPEGTVTAMDGYSLTGYVIEGSDVNIAEEDGSLIAGVTIDSVVYTDANGVWMYEGTDTLTICPVWEEE